MAWIAIEYDFSFFIVISSFVLKIIYYQFNKFRYVYSQRLKHNNGKRILNMRNLISGDSDEGSLGHESETATAGGYGL